MNCTRFLFVDFENVHSFDLSSLGDDVKVYIFVGSQQNRIPFELVTEAQKRGDLLEWIRIAGQGRNALDFHIAYYLGDLNGTVSKDIEFTVLSKDTGYDPLVRHIKDLGRSCSRINSLKEIARGATPGADDPATQRAITILSKLDKTKRPRTRNTLGKHLQSALGRKMGEDEVESIVDNLFITGKVSEQNRRLIYKL